jgi:hypothetical protein
MIENENRDECVFSTDLRCVSPVLLRVESDLVFDVIGE